MASMFFLLLCNSGFARSVPLACSYAPVYFSSYEVFEQQFVVPSLVSCDCIAKIPVSAERTVLGFHGASGARRALLYVVVWGSDEEVAVLAETCYVADLVVGFEIFLGVFPTAKHAVEEVLTVGEKVGRADVGRVDCGRVYCGAPQIFRVAYHVTPTSATVTTTVQIGVLYVIALIMAWVTAAQTALVMFANAPHHCM